MRTLPLSWRGVVSVVVLFVVSVGAAGQVSEADSAVSAARSLSRAFERAAGRIEQSVVHITTQSEIQRIRRDVFGRAFRAGPPELRQTGLGSGVVIDRGGLVVTNHHVIARGDRLVVRLHDGREVEAELVGSDEATDLAVLRISASDLVPASFGDSDELRVGEWVLAVGSPFGFDYTVTAGIVSAKGRTNVGNEQNPYQEYIQTDAAINPGNSGGPLINLDGEVIGINSAIISRIGQSAGLGFAIPSVMVQSVVDSIVRSGRVQRGYLGIMMEELTPERRRELGLAPGTGVVIERVVEGGPAARAGIEPGDVILRIDGRVVEGGLNRLRNLIALTPPGAEVSIELLRDGSRMSTSARLSDLASARAEAMGGEPVRELGVIVREMTRQMSRELGYTRHVPGLLVLDIEAGTPAAGAGMEVGDILLAADGTAFSGVDELRGLLARSLGETRIELARGRVRGHVEVQLR